MRAILLAAIAVAAFSTAMLKFLVDGRKPAGS
jgi:hypothetical protein